MATVNHSVYSIVVGIRKIWDFVIKLGILDSYLCID